MIKNGRVKAPPIISNQMDVSIKSVIIDRSVPLQYGENGCSALFTKVLYHFPVQMSIVHFNKYAHLIYRLSMHNH